LGLFVILVFPIIIFLFLKFFGDNRYQEVPVYYQNDLPENREDCNYPNGKYAIPDISLASENGQRNIRELLKHKISVVSFFSSPCNDICEEVFNQIWRVQSAFENDNTVQIITLLLDNRKSPVDQRQHLEADFQIDPKRWKFFTTDENELHKLLHCGFILDVFSEEQLFAIGNTIVLVDKQKEIRGYYEGTSREDVDRLIHEIYVLLYEYDLSEQESR